MSKSETLVEIVFYAETVEPFISWSMNEKLANEIYESEDIVAAYKTKKMHYDDLFDQMCIKNNIINHPKEHIKKLDKWLEDCNYNFSFCIV